jgi:Spy/CpxP family protein refolding chaperone
MLIARKERSLIHSKAVALAVLTGLLFSVAASAQSQVEAIAKTSPEQRAKVQTGLMKEKLALTAAQLPKVEAINLATAQKMQPVLESADGPMVRMRKARENEVERDTALQQVLTPQQYQQWLIAKDEIKQKAEQKLIEKRKSGGQ